MIETGRRSNISSTSCFCSSFSGRCAAMVSARRPASSMPGERGQDFRRNLLVQFDVLVELAEHRAAHGLDFMVLVAGFRHRLAARHEHDSASMTLPPGALRAFDQHLDGAVGQLEHLQDVGDGANAYRSSKLGSSLAADFCATSRMLLPASIAISSALIDFGRPTNSGITMCGNTTTSRNGNSGRTGFRGELGVWT
jgi:hypothetical protein